MHKFIAEQLKIYKVSAHEPLNKVVDHGKPSNFFLEYFQVLWKNMDKNVTKVQSNSKHLTETKFRHKFPMFRALYFKMHFDLDKILNTKLVAI